MGDSREGRNQRPYIKVCGITRPEDAVLATELGADAIGLVFWPASPRSIPVEVARSITRELPPFVAVVGVFVNSSHDEVLEVARAVPLTVVQFHGDEADEDVISFPWRVVRAIPVGSPEAENRLARLPHKVTLLLDAADARCRGGTGRVIDWSAAAHIASQRRVLLAGGLRPDNVGEAIARVRPWGLDVSSGVESAPGVKDAPKLEAFFQAVARELSSPRNQGESPTSSTDLRRDVPDSPMKERAAVEGCS
jgi:phosphoribosylanthranilate isomerase